VLETATVPPTTALEIPFLEVTGLPYCDVVELVAPSIQTFANEGSDFGDGATVRDTYVSALTAFDALEQVATREIIDDVHLLERTLNDAVYAAAAVDWDITQVTDDAAAGVTSDAVLAALQRLRRYTTERCAIDIYGLEPPITTAPAETPTQRLLRVLEYTFPSLSDESILCLGSRLPVEWDPDSPDEDDTAINSAMAGCGIDPNAPSTGTRAVTATTSD